VLKPDADRASAVTEIQKEAIERAKELDPDATRHLERVRDVGPDRDKWRHEQAPEDVFNDERRIFQNVEFRRSATN
jgi:hypothetical protein